MLLARLITFEVALMFLWLELYVTCCLKMLSAGCLLANREWEYFVTGTSTIRGWQTLGHLILRLGQRGLAHHLTEAYIIYTSCDVIYYIYIFF